MNPRPRLSLSAAGRAAGFTLGCRGVADVRARERETEGARGPWGTGVSHRGRSETGRGCAAPEARPGWRGIERPPTPPTGAAPPYSRTPPARVAAASANPTPLHPQPNTTPVAHFRPAASPGPGTPQHRRDARPPRARQARGGWRTRRAASSQLPGTRLDLFNACLGRDEIFASRAHV